MSECPRCGCPEGDCKDFGGWEVERECLERQLAQANEKFSALLSERMEANERLRRVADRVVRTYKDVEKHGYAPFRRMMYALEKELKVGDTDEP